MNAVTELHPDTESLDLRAWWMPFTHNRYYKEKPRLVRSAKGAYFTLMDGRQVFDCLSGLWCTPLGHSHPAIVAAIQRQVETLDYVPGFQLGNPLSFALAARIAKLAGRPDDKVFFVNSGSEAVDTALKMAVAYHRVRGEGTRTRIIGRERGYHGVGMGGTSVGGIPANRKMFASLMIPGVDHLPHTYNADEMRYSRGQPAWGVHLADELERIVALHDASNIAAVIVEPMQGSAGVIVPPKGYLERLREICTKHGILLIFDEVITGPHHLREGRRQRLRAARWRARQERDPRGVHDRTRPRDRVLPRLHVFGPPARDGRRPCHARDHAERQADRARGNARAGAGSGRAHAAGRAARGRHQERRSRRGG
jgi:adenosylmethionine-8-amino-7-oxononanoate aminotransferase